MLPTDYEHQLLASHYSTVHDSSHKSADVIFFLSLSHATLSEASNNFRFLLE